MKNTVLFVAALQLFLANTAWSHSSTAVPQGMVAFFDRDKCPQGWGSLPTANGRYLVGLQPGGERGATVGSALSDKENRAAGAHVHGYTLVEHFNKSPNKNQYEHRDPGGGHMPSGGSTTDNGVGLVSGTNAPFVQFLVCRKN